MMRNLSRILLPVTLVILIVLSIVFSFYIWTSPSRYDSNNRVNTRTSQSQLATRTIDDIYLPTQVIYNNDQGQQNLLTDRKVNLVTQFKSLLRNWQATRIRKDFSVSASDYQKSLTTKDAYVLNYPDKITVKMFNTVFGQSLKLHQSAQFDRILIPLNNSRQLYLLNDADHSQYTVTLKKKSANSLRKIAQSPSLKQILVKLNYQEGQTHLDYQQDVKLNQYSYLLNKQAAGDFATRLLNKNGESSISVHDKKGQQEYSSGGDNYKRVTVNTKLGTVYYENYTITNKKQAAAYNTQLQTGYDRLSTIGIPMDNIRYYNYDATSGSVTYRSYVEGFPIFNQTEYGTVRVQLAANGLERYNFSLYSLQIPVPTTGKTTVTLPSTAKVAAELVADGYKKRDIGPIELGYEWSQNTSSKLVVDLNPTYYVYYNKKWQTYKQLLNK